MDLTDFPKIQAARKAFERFFKGPQPIKLQAVIYDHLQTNVLAIKLIAPLESVSYLNICRDSSNVIQQAVCEALSEWAENKTEEIREVALEAARNAEIKAAKHLQQDAINLLTVANQ